MKYMISFNGVFGSLGGSSIREERRMVTVYSYLDILKIKGEGNEYSFPFFGCCRGRRRE